MSTWTYVYTCTCGVSVSDRTQHELHELKHLMDTYIKEYIDNHKKKWWQVWR